MKILIDIGHPVHVHLFRNFIKEMQNKGHEFRIIARDRDCICELLDEYNIPYVKRNGYKGVIGKSIGMILIDLKILVESLKFKPDMMMGEGNPYIAQVSWLLRKKSIIFDDTEHATMQIAMMKPFARYIITPSCYKNDYGRKQVRYDGYKELAYLHPKYFTPDKDIIKKLGIRSSKAKSAQRYFVLRFVGWDASHDNKESGIVDKIGLVKHLEKYGKVLISSEGKLPAELEKYRIKLPAKDMHSILNDATLFVGEGATMASECSMLGTPAIYVNTLKLGYITDLENQGLLFDITEYGKIISKIDELMKTKNLKSVFKRRRDKMLSSKIDLTSWMMKFVEKVSKE